MKTLSKNFWLIVVRLLQAEILVRGLVSGLGYETADQLNSGACT